MKLHRHVIAVTSTRADYGLLRPILKELDKRDDLCLSVVVTGSHLVQRFGQTIDEVAQDGWEIVSKIEILGASDSDRATSKSFGLAAMGMADVLDKHQPDILLLLGDRYEMLAVASAATIAKVPIAHIHGGEITRGAIDDAIRHAITKMAHLHFATTPEYRDRIIQMGEQPERVFWSGAPGVESARALKPIDRDALSASIGLELAPPFLLATYHPVTLTPNETKTSLMAMLSAIDKVEPGSLVLTYPNFDSENQIVIEMIEDYCRDRTWSTVVKSLGHNRYLSAISYADAVVGNSSSGIIEAPALGTPTVNIGTRQDGRVRASSIIDCSEKTEDIADAIRRALAPEFQALAAQAETPYYRANCARVIANHVAETPLVNILRKQFYCADQQG